MVEFCNTFVDFIADFSYDSAWVGDPHLKPPGKDVAELLASGLCDRGFDIRRVEPMDYEYDIECRSGSYSFEISATVDDHATMRRWNVHCPPSVGLWGRLTGKSDQDDHGDLLRAIHEILLTSDRIRDVRWFPSFEPPEFLKDPRPAPWKDWPGKAVGRSAPSMWDRELDGGV